MVSTLYLFLVLPHEWQKNSKEFKGKIDLSLAEKALKDSTCVHETNRGDSYEFLDRLRNAVSHGHVTLQGNKVFYKDNFDNKTFTGSISLSDLGKVLQELNKAIAQYVHCEM